MNNNLTEDLIAYDFKTQLTNLITNTTLSPLRKFEIFESISKDLQYQVEKDLNKQVEEYKQSVSANNDNSEETLN